MSRLDIFGVCFLDSCEIFESGVLFNRSSTELALSPFSIVRFMGDLDSPLCALSNDGSPEPTRLWLGLGSKLSIFSKAEPGRLDLASALRIFSNVGAGNLEPALLLAGRGLAKRLLERVLRQCFLSSIPPEVFRVTITNFAWSVDKLYMKGIPMASTLKATAKSRKPAQAMRFATTDPMRLTSTNPDARGTQIRKKRTVFFGTSRRQLK
mmetsp:Transcript_22577/g.45344  ORF Transcript_22577/g.45344 Transcript_22577/m.45344 type:complete len:209 (-) Transcript_22577:320-946(-)